MSYRNLEIWQLARELVVDIHRMTLDELPKFEMFEEGTQIRRAMKSVKSNIVDGYGPGGTNRTSSRAWNVSTCRSKKKHRYTRPKTPRNEIVLYPESRISHPESDARQAKRGLRRPCPERTAP